jgi:hypothetical protein
LHKTIFSANRNTINLFNLPPFPKERDLIAVGKKEIAP